MRFFVSEDECSAVAASSRRARSGVVMSAAANTTAANALPADQAAGTLTVFLKFTAARKRFPPKRHLTISFFAVPIFERRGLKVTFQRQRLLSLVVRLPIFFLPL